MEFFLFLFSIHFYLIVGGQRLIRDWTPAVVLCTTVPSIFIVNFISHFRFVEHDIDSIFAGFFFDFDVVSWGESVDVDDTAVGEDFIIDERREFRATETESDVALRGCI